MEIESLPDPAPKERPVRLRRASAIERPLRLACYLALWMVAFGWILMVHADSDIPWPEYVNPLLWWRFPVGLPGAVAFAMHAEEAFIAGLIFYPGVMEVAWPLPIWAMYGTITYHYFRRSRIWSLLLLALLALLLTMNVSGCHYLFEVLHDTHGAIKPPRFPDVALRAPSS